MLGQEVEMKNVLCIILIWTFAAAQSGDSVILAPGNPTLTQRMMNDAIGVWETFLELKFTEEQRRKLQQAVIDNRRLEEGRPKEDSRFYGRFDVCGQG